MLDLAAERPRFGYQRLHILLRREGFEQNHKLTYRTYREEKLQVRRKRRKRVAASPREQMAAPTEPFARGRAKLPRLQRGRLLQPPRGGDGSRSLDARRAHLPDPRCVGGTLRLPLDARDGQRSGVSVGL